MCGCGSARAPDLPVATFFFLAMVWYSIEIQKKNKKFPPRARTRNLEGRPPQGGNLKIIMGWGSSSPSPTVLINPS